MRNRLHSSTTGDDGFEALQHALRVMPSPQFVARVREQVRRQPMGAPAGRWARLAVGAALATATVLPAALWIDRAAPERSAPAVLAREPGTGPGRAPAAEVAPMPSGRAEGVARSQPDRGRAARDRPGAGHLASGVSTAEVLVPEDQRRALNRLLLAMREGRATVPGPIGPPGGENGRLVEPRLIEIPLLRPIEPLALAPVDRSGSEEK